MKARRWTRSAVALIALCLAVFFGGRAVWGAWARGRYAGTHQDLAPSMVESLGDLPSELHESSGLAVSRHLPGVLWTHNDSGDRPRFYAIDLAGRLTGTWNVRGASARDWEDVDLSRCPGDDEGGTSCLYLADTGNNSRGRETLTIYVVAEPETGVGGGEVDLVGRLRFSYPDEPHDAEAVAVHPSGDLVVVTKGRTGTIDLFRLSAAALARAVQADTAIVLPPGWRLPIVPSPSLYRMTTGAAFDPAGERLAIRTYTEIYVLPWPLPDVLPERLASCFLGDLEPGGEAISWEDEHTFLLTSEADGATPASLTRVRCGFGGK